MKISMYKELNVFLYFLGCIVSILFKKNGKKINFYTKISKRCKKAKKFLFFVKGFD